MAMTKAEAEGVARLFLTDYPGALELAYKFRDNTAQQLLLCNLMFFICPNRGIG